LEGDFKKRPSRVVDKFSRRSCCHPQFESLFETLVQSIREHGLEPFRFWLTL
jgi:hypothetical protein